MPDVNPHGQIFVGPAVSNGDLDLIVKTGSKPAIEVEVALFTEKNGHGLNDLLLKITGAAAASAGLDGKTMRYHSVPAGTGTDFRYFKAGEERTRLTTRDTWSGWTTMQLHLEGKSYDLRAHPRGAADARPLHLLTAYDEASGEALSRLHLERQLAPTGAAMKAKVTVDWGGFENDPRARRAVALMLDALPAACARLREDEMGKAALSDVRAFAIELKATGGVVASQNGANVRLKVGVSAGDDQAAQDVTARTEWVVNLLESAL